MRQTDLWRLGKPRSYQLPKLFRAPRQEHHRICNSAYVEIPGLGPTSATFAHNHDRGFELALVQWLVLRHELPDQHVLDHRIIASYGLIAPLVTMSCRLSLRRVASRGVLPRERFSPLALFRPPRDVRLESASGGRTEAGLPDCQVRWTQSRTRLFFRTAHECITTQCLRIVGGSN
jgi:hypothetical protein